MSNGDERDQELDDLVNERDFLLQSLQDLEEEHQAGDVSDEDYNRLYDRYTTRAAEVLRSLDSRNAPAPTKASPERAVDRNRQDSTPTNRRRRLLLIGGVVFILAGVTFGIVVTNTNLLLPGETISGNVSLPLGQKVTQEFSQAAIEEQDGDIAEALALYEEVESQEPGNSQALSQAGWLEFEAGILGKSSKSIQQGVTDEEGAVALNPELPNARAYLGSMLLIEDQPAKAVVQYGQFINDKPGSSELSPFLPDIRRAYSEAKLPLPASIATASKK